MTETESAEEAHPQHLAASGPSTVRPVGGAEEVMDGRPFMKVSAGAEGVFEPPAGSGPCGPRRGDLRRPSRTALP
ncbi:hypothetical protein ACVNF4_28060 [Streptomyces sp. S6]